MLTDSNFHMALLLPYLSAPLSDITITAFIRETRHLQQAVLQACKEEEEERANRKKHPRDPAAFHEGTAFSVFKPAAWRILTSINAELLQLQAFFAPRPPSAACVR